jgi:hypothetical protein
MRVSITLFLAFLINASSEDPKPFALLLVAIVLIIVLLESIKLWRLTNVFTKIDMPIFPKFKQSMQNCICPIGRRFDRTRELITSQNLSEKVLLEIGDDGHFVIHFPIFYNYDQHYRLQIILDSFRNGCPMVNCILTSFTEESRAIVTNNLQSRFC